MKLIDLATLKINNLYTRYDLFEESVQPGIFSPKGTDAIFLFSDLEAMEKYGYIFDGWEAETGTMHYTGQGQNGNQEFKLGNLTILNTLVKKKDIYFFLAESGSYDGRKQRYRYLGEFVLNQQSPYREEDVVDVASGLKRSMIVFHLNPLDKSTVTNEVEGLSVHAAKVPHKPCTTVVGLEQNLGSDYTVPAREKTKAVKEEKKIEDILVKYIKAQGGLPKRLKIAIGGRKSYLYTDVWDDKNKYLYEIKSSTSREMIRSAIGQLLDYKFQIKQMQTEGKGELSVEKCIIVVPHKPTYDLVQLIQSSELQFGVMYVKDGHLIVCD